ncbi:MAG: hypothetical protein Q9165_008926, partial [Trypethelium subeluteriae]
TYKFNNNSYLNKYKARIYARGDLQEVKDNKDNKLMTPTLKVFRALIVFITVMDLEIWQLDIKNTYLNNYKGLIIIFYVDDIITIFLKKITQKAEAVLNKIKK